MCKHCNRSKSDDTMSTVPDRLRKSLVDNRKYFLNLKFKKFRI